MCVVGLCRYLCNLNRFAASADGFVFLDLPHTESSDEDEASGDEGLPDEDSDVSMIQSEKGCVSFGVFVPHTWGGGGSQCWVNVVIAYSHC